MKSISNLRMLPFRTWVLSLLLFSSACTDNPVGDGDHHEDHAEVYGLALVSGTDVLYQVLDGQVTCDTQPCGIVIAQGSQSPILVVQFLDAEGQEVHAEDMEEGLSLSVSVESGAISTAEVIGDWSIRATGVSVGTTRVQIVLNHEGHADFTSPPLANSNALTITVVSP